MSGAEPSSSPFCAPRSVKTEHPLEAEARLGSVRRTAGGTRWTSGGRGVYGWRRLCLLAVVCGCCAAYWMHFENRFAELDAQANISDTEQTLSDTERASLLRLRSMFWEKMGLRVRVRITKVLEETPNVQRDVVFVSVSPTQQAAVVVLPPLVRGAVVLNTQSVIEKRLRVCMASSKRAGGCIEDALAGLLTELTTNL